MTEAQWLACDDPARMLKHILGGPVYEDGCEEPPDCYNHTSYPHCRSSDRKLRLFAAALCRRFWDSLTNQRCRQALEAAESHADGMASDSELQAFYWGSDGAFLYRPFTGDAHLAATIATWPVAGEAARNVLLVCSSGRRGLSLKFWAVGKKHEDARRVHVGLVRDIFGNPFCSAALSPSWQTGTALSLARQMYDSRDFSAMPILADALQDSGCDSEDILNHCRDEKVAHVRGCWVVDLVLEKE